MVANKALQYEVSDFIKGLIKRNPNEPEFIQAATEVAESVWEYYRENRNYYDNSILDRISEPDRIVAFRVTWEDDQGNIQVNKGYRVQFNNSLGPYKGGLRFHPSVNQSILKFLGFEQIFKNSLTTLPMGAGKGGSDFDPKGKSDREVMRFCQAFMTELNRHIDKDIDVPAGDIGVGGREIGYMIGQYKKLNLKYKGILTGKGIDYGGSLIRTEATGYGSAYFAEEMALHKGDSLKDKICTVSGSGNVAQYTIEKLIHLGAIPVTASDSSGFIYDKNGIRDEKLEFLKELKNHKRGRIKEYADKYGCEFYSNRKPWSVPCEAAFPSATQNEINVEDAQELINNGCRIVSEGANMPSTPEAVTLFQVNGVLFGPGKAANAGGVAVSGLEMAQNSMRIKWTHQEVEGKLLEIMKRIHGQCIKYGDNGDMIDYVKGANIAGFVKVADTMLHHGI
jgi:glutamate dehydrogenase (NADP+)